MAKGKHPKTMEEVINSIRRVCELAKNLESDLPNLANQPAMLSLSIDEIVQTLSAAKEKLLIPPQGRQIPSSSFTQMQPQLDANATLMQEWLRSSYAMTMNQLFQMQPLQAERSTAPYEARSLVESKTMGRVDFSQLRARDTLQIGEMGGTSVVDSERSSKRSQGEVQAMEASPSRPRRSNRNIDLEKRKKIVPAPEFGNREMPPEDGFTWRKYGQKEILGSKYPRSYYRCTHQKLYECGAKKQVQRHDRNPSMFEVTYRGNHTCHMSPTAPSSVPPQQLLSREMTQGAVPSQLSLSSASASGRWLSSMNLSLGAGASSSRYGADYPVADMADAMFNSAAGSSSGNSMESLFPPAKDKWEPKEAKRRKD